MFDVGDPFRNVALTWLFVALAVVTLLSVIPWSVDGRNNRWALFLPLVGLAVYGAYEAVMPTAYDIRVDLLLVWPMGAAVLVSWMVRLAMTRRARGRRPEADG